MFRTLSGQVAAQDDPGQEATLPAKGVNRKFRAPAQNRVSVSDFTYGATWKGLLHVVFVIDEYLTINNTERLGKAGIEPSAGSVSDSCDALGMRSTASSKPKSSNVGAHGAISKSSNTQPSNGSTGSTTAAYSSPLGTSRPRKPKHTSTQHCTKPMAEELTKISLHQTRRGSLAVW